MPLAAHTRWDYLQQRRMLVTRHAHVAIQMHIDHITQLTALACALTGLFLSPPDYIIHKLGRKREIKIPEVLRSCVIWRALTSGVKADMEIILHVCHLCHVILSRQQCPVFPSHEPFLLFDCFP